VFYTALAPVASILKQKNRTKDRPKAALSFVFRFFVVSTALARLQSKRPPAAACVVPDGFTPIHATRRTAMLRWCSASAVLLALSFVTTSDARQDKDKGKKEPPPTFTDPAKAGLDYLYQGEYVGTTAGSDKIAAQVIARGDGTFDIVFLPGGLPGEGWDGKTKIRAAAKLEMPEKKEEKAIQPSAVITNKEKWSGSIDRTQPVTMTVKTDKGEDFKLTHVERKSKTLGAEPPKGAIVLFDASKSLDEWNKNGKLSEDGFLLKNATTKKTFQDFTLHIEFRVPFMPKSKGQARANSGVHPQNRFEIQVLDSFGLDSKKDDCAAIYGQTPPSLNACYPPLSWQTYDMVYKAARFDKDGKVIAQPRITVYHNGIKVHDDVEIKAKANPSPGPLHVSEHGNPVVYRNIWIVPEETK
jgi:hypothetical protein